MAERRSGMIETPILCGGEGSSVWKGMKCSQDNYQMRLIEGSWSSFDLEVPPPLRLR